VSGPFNTVEVREVSRYYGRRRALSRVSLTARAGEIVGLFGPNGSGKSTLLAILSTLLRPSVGTVHFGASTDADGARALRASIGLLGHDLFLYGDLSARENLEFFGALYAVADLDRRISRALEQAGLAERPHDRVSGFSRGLRQRLALERALLHDPSLVLLDEPFTGLDDASVERLRGRLAGLRERGAIVVMATHDFDTAENLVDRALCLDNGHARELPAGPGSLRERYRRAMVRGEPA
jgi:heme ABC exporter ATP-binding subunit CcmA